MGDLSRRGFIQGNLAIALATLLLERGQAALSDTRPGAAFGPAATPTPTPSPPWDGTRFTAPYTLASSSAMSQDYFLTDEVVIDPDANLVAPYVALDGSTAALVVTDNAISVLERDASSSTGWSYTALSDFAGNFSHMSAIAAGAGSDGNMYAALLAGTGDKKGTEDPALYWLWWTPKTGWLGSGMSDTNVLPTSAQITAQRALDGQIYFTIWDDDATLRLWAPETSYDVTVITDIAGQSMTDPQIFWSGSAPPNASCGIAAVAPSFEGISGVVWSPQVGRGSAVSFPEQDQAIEFLDGLLWVGQSAGSNGPDVFATSDGTVLRMPDFTNSADAGGDFGEIDAFFTWGPEGANSAIALSGGDVKVMLTADDGTIAPAITIEQSVAKLYGVATPSTDAAFFTVEAGTGVLSVLTKDADLGIWTRLAVQQPAATVLDISTWRTQLTLLDANGIPVDSTDVVIAPDRAVALWQTGGSLVASPGAPIKKATDNHGRVTVAFPVVELDAPQLTVTITDKDGVSTQEFQVAPDGAVHAYLGGTGSLLGQPALTGQALYDAKGSDGQPLSPTLTSPDSATAVVSAMTSCVNVGNGKVDTTKTQSFAIDMSGDQPVYSESANPAAFLHLLPRTPAGGILGDLQKDLRAIEHAVRNAVTKVTHVVANFVSDAAGWVINLALDLGQTVQFAVDGLRSAITAIHGILHAIEVDVERAVQWLRMVVDDLIGETESHAQVIQDLIRNGLPDVLRLWSSDLKSTADGYFSGLTEQVSAEFGDAGELTTGSATSSLGTVTGSPSEGGGSTSLVGSGSGFDAGGLLHDVTHNWLVEKVEHEFDELLQGNSGIWDDSDGLLAQLIVELGDLGELAEGLGELIWTAIKTIATPTAAKGMAISRLTSVVGKLVGQVLTLADNTVDIFASLLNALADLIDDFLDTPIVGLPLLQSLLSKLGHSTDLTAGHVFSLVAAFPAALIHRVVVGAPLAVPPLSTQAATGALGDPADDGFDWAQWNACIHAGCRIAHVPLDLAADLMLFASGGEVSKPLQFTALWDGVTSLAILGTNWPSAKRSDGTTRRPFSSLPPTDTLLDKVAVAHWGTSGLGPLLGIVLWAARVGNASGGSGTTAPPKPDPSVKLTTPYGWWVPWFNLLVFGTTMGLALYTTIKNDKLTTEERDIQISATVLELLPRMGAPLATQYINASAEGLPMALKVIFDVVQAASAGLLIDEALTTP